MTKKRNKSKSIHTYKEDKVVYESNSDSNNIKKQKTKDLIKQFLFNSILLITKGKTLMFKFSEKSIQLLNTVDKRLGILANEVIKVSKVDFAITQGWRNQETQNRYFKDGKSQCDGITKKSKHQDGKAIDILCYDPHTNKPTYERKFYYYIAGLFQLKADELKINSKWGGWWSFEDCCHFELE